MTNAAVTLVCLLILLAPGSGLHAQTFTKVTDTTNAVVTDKFQNTGGSWVDLNGDGFLDLFVAHGNSDKQNNGLYLNDRHGGFIRVTTGPVVNDGGSSIGGTWGDYDNDGRPDLFVTNRFNAGNFLYRGLGDTAFAKITTGSVVTDTANSNSSSWVDIDNDGFLDLFVVNFAGKNFYYHNGGPPDFVFTKVDTGSILLNNGNSIVGAWSDYNNDRRPDLFVGNGANENNELFTNNGGGTFTKTVFNDARSTLGASWGDFNNDGNMDLFVANYLDQENILYTNSGPPGYTLVRMTTGAVSTGVGKSVGSCWGDFDNDGNLDLFVANDGEKKFLYHNDGPPNYTFTKVTVGDVVNDLGNSFGCACADYDNDGFLDIFVANRLNQQNFLYHNNGNANGWIEIECVGTTSNRSAIGTKVRLLATVGGSSRWQMREVQSQTGYNSETLRLHLGLGDATTIDSLRVEWPGGTTEVYTNVAMNRLITITEHGTISSAGDAGGLRPPPFSLLQNYPNPFNPSTTIEYEVPQQGVVRLELYDVTGRLIRTLESVAQHPGRYRVLWDGRDDRGRPVASGAYFCRLTAGGNSQLKKMLLLK